MFTTVVFFLQQQSVLHRNCLPAMLKRWKPFTGTIYVDNNFTFYVNGELITKDLVPIFCHNAVNVTFWVERGKDITLLSQCCECDILGPCNRLDERGNWFGDRCIGDGGLRAMFSNGVVIISSWVCSTYSYSPVNWRECFGAISVRNASNQLIPECKQESMPMLQGCYTRNIPHPEGWNLPGFDDSSWEYALEWEDEVVGWGLCPAGCDDPNTIISSDPNGDNVTCPENLNCSESRFIWRPDLLLGNGILCRYTVKFESAGVTNSAGNHSQCFCYCSHVHGCLEEAGCFSEGQN